MAKKSIAKAKVAKKVVAPKVFQFVRKRDGRIVPFDQTRITEAILKALHASGEGNGRDAKKISARVLKVLLKRYAPTYVLGIEEIQDSVENALILLDYAKTAKAYILYRKERERLREARKEVPVAVKQLVTASKKYFKNPLAEFVYYRTYSRWNEEEGRRETWIETAQRYVDFMKENLGDKLTEKEYKEVHDAILNQQAMPSMRLLQFAGKAARKTNVAAYNCSFIAPTRFEDFAEIVYISMCGTGVGFSVEHQNVEKLPQIERQTGEKLQDYVIEDSKEGWADSLLFGMKTWFAGKDVVFDYSQLRAAGVRLKTMGGRSSGPAPLRELLDFTRRKILAKQGRRLSTLDVHDIICKIGEIVVSGGVRRSALISLSDLDDPEMRDAKKGQFYLTEPQRSLANNSAVYNEKPTAAQFLDEWVSLAKSGTGERGIFNRGGLHTMLPKRRIKALKGYLGNLGTNPCVTGDTLVYVADGRGNVPIKQLADEGKDVPVFCLDEKGSVAIRTMRNPRITGYNTAVYNITLDDGSVIKATTDHKIRLKTGEYRKVKDLKHGDGLALLTRFEASIKDMFPAANSNSQDYWWLNTGLRSNIAEHRAIASFHYNAHIPQRYVVHHKDRNAQNNRPENLAVMSKAEHDALHSQNMIGDSNPMRRAKDEWSEEKWFAYRQKQARNSAGDNNKNFSGVSDDELRHHALKLTRLLGRRFSHENWILYAKENGLPQSFSKWRKDHLGGVLGLAKWSALEAGCDHIDADPRVVASYQKWSSLGYDCEIHEGQLLIHKTCEVCGRDFTTHISTREYGRCSASCGVKGMWSNEVRRQLRIASINAAHAKRKEELRGEQARMYSDLKFRLEREPLKREWARFCEEHNISREIARASSPFRTYEDLKESSAMYNHKVVSVAFAGYEDVYNGTVDEFHNFFIGGFASSTRNGKRKFVYINNLQCGEIILQSRQFCNLSEVVARPEDTEATLLEKVRLATIVGTYQSTLTNFGYLSKEWKENCEHERLLGVSVTGQWDSPAARKPEALRKMRDYAIRVNEEYAKRFGITPSTCITCVKPSGNLSQTVDASSGMHTRYAKYYIRRVRISATDSLFKMLKDQKLPYHPEVGQVSDTANTYVLEFPVKAPEGAATRNDVTALSQMEYWKLVKTNFTEHNPSVTVYVGDDEWIAVANWLYNNWEYIGGLSFLPKDNHVYELAPYEEITEARYNELIAKFPDIDFSQIFVYEKQDETEAAKELACVAGVCEIT